MNDVLRIWDLFEIANVDMNIKGLTTGYFAAVKKKADFFMYNGFRRTFQDA